LRPVTTTSAALSLFEDDAAERKDEKISKATEPEALR
jgi:hypothetical protein